LSHDADKEGSNSLTLHGSYQFDGNLAFNLSNSVTEDVGQETFFALPVILDNAVTLTINGQSSSLIFDEGISESTPGLGLTTAGTGLAVFTNAALSYTGTTDVNAGDFELATPSSSPIQVDAGASVYGAGGEAPSVSVSAGGIFTAGDNGITLDSGLTLTSGSILDVDLTKLPDTSTLAPTTVTVNAGSIDLGGATLAVYEVQSTQSDSDSLTLIQNNTGAPVNGTFAGLPEGSVVTSIYRNYILSYEGGASGHDVTLTAVPGAADHLAFVGQPSSTAAAGQSTGTVVVDVEDANGSVVTGDNSSVSLSSSTSLGGTRTGTSGGRRGNIQQCRDQPRRRLHPHGRRQRADIGGQQLIHHHPRSRRSTGCRPTAGRCCHSHLAKHLVRCVPSDDRRDLNMDAQDAQDDFESASHPFNPVHPC
jgi:hypothetical protein